MKRYVIAGNWKMNLNKEEVKNFFTTYRSGDVSIANETITPIVCPVFPLLPIALRESDGTGVQIGAQNVSEHTSGAFTGEVSANILKSIDIPYCIIGHSERRQYFAETDETIRKKWLRLREEKINPIICVGETLFEREEGDTFIVIKKQIETICHEMPLIEGEDLLIAYEPVWAIGTGKTATPEQAQEVHLYIRELLTLIYGDKAQDIPLLYGGSVKPSNIKELLSMPDINGALIGGASLVPADFAQMVKTAQELL